MIDFKKISELMALYRWNFREIRNRIIPHFLDIPQMLNNRFFRLFWRNSRFLNPFFDFENILREWVGCSAIFWQNPPFFNQLTKFEFFLWYFYEFHVFCLQPFDEICIFLATPGLSIWYMKYRGGGGFVILWNNFVFLCDSLKKFNFFSRSVEEIPVFTATF